MRKAATADLRGGRREPWPSFGARELDALRLPAEIQPPAGPAPVDALMAHYQPDPGARDLRIGQIDIFTGEPRTHAVGIDQAAARAVVPGEQQIHALAGQPRFGQTLLPFFNRIARNRRIGAAVPPARPVSGDRVVSPASTQGAPS